MAFLNPWAIAVGVLVIGAPIIIHLLTRPRPVEYSLSTVRLLSEVIQQRRAKSRIRDWVILLLRTVAIALLAAAFARPFFQAGETVSRTADGDAARVILLDVSQSMAAGSGGAQRITQGKATAIEFLDGIRGVEAGVIFIGSKPRPVFDQVSPNIASLRRAVEEVGVRPERADVNAALQLAGDMLASVDNGERELVVISDFQRTNWGLANLNAIPEGTKIQFQAVTSSVTDNLAISDVRFETQPMIGQPAVVQVEVSNYSGADSEVSCQLRIGTEQRRLTGSVASRGSRTFETSVTFDQPGWVHGEVSLTSNLDVMIDDDARPLAVEVRDTPRVLLLTRQPESSSTSSWYLEQALNIILARDGDALPVTRIEPGRVPVATWPEADLFLIDHPGALEQEAVAHIAARVRRGRSLMYVTSELADAMNVQVLSDAFGSGFQPPVELVSETAGRPRKELFVSKVKSRQMPFRSLGVEVESVFRPVRFSGGLPTSRAEEGLSDQVLAELSDSSTLLYMTTADAGRVAVLNADLGSSNWAFQPTFIPILGELIQELIRGGNETGTALCGEPLVRSLPPDVQTEEKLIAVPGTDATPINSDYGQWQSTDDRDQPAAVGGGLIWAWPEPTGPGVYEVRQDGRVVMAVATAAPSIESDLQSLDETILTERIGEGQRVGYSTTDQEEPDDDHWWSWLMVACVLGLISELVALRGFRV